MLLILFDLLDEIEVLLENVLLMGAVSIPKREGEDFGCSCPWMRKLLRIGSGSILSNYKTSSSDTPEAISIDSKLDQSHSTQSKHRVLPYLCPKC
jgi:hypothetical protein